MPVQSTNPDYDAHIEEWRMMDDALEGEGAIKLSPRNLPKPSGMTEAEKLDGAGNAYLYQNYTARAQYEHWCGFAALDDGPGLPADTRGEATLGAEGTGGQRHG